MAFFFPGEGNICDQKGTVDIRVEAAIFFFYNVYIQFESAIVIFGNGADVLVEIKRKCMVDLINENR